MRRAVSRVSLEGTFPSPVSALPPRGGGGVPQGPIAQLPGAPYLPHPI